MLLLLFRGLPGSGKSTLAKQLCNVVISADDYFIWSDGSYKFDPLYIKDAHNQCHANTASCIRLGIPIIGVANTFTREWEMEKYFELVKECSYQISTVIVENRHRSPNSHEVPNEVVEQMKERFQVKL